MFQLPLFLPAFDDSKS